MKKDWYKEMQAQPTLSVIDTEHFPTHGKGWLAFRTAIIDVLKERGEISTKKYLSLKAAQDETFRNAISVLEERIWKREHPNEPTEPAEPTESTEETL